MAGVGYDGPSGLGTPAQLALFEPTGAPEKEPQQVQFTSVAPEESRVGGTGFAVTARASSGLPVVFSSQTPSVCGLEAATVTFLAAGSCTLQASQSGDGQYQPALPVEQSFTVAKDPQTITFTSSPGAPTVGGAAYTVSASASSGLRVSFSSATTAVCSVEGSSVTFIGVGTCTVTADQTGSQRFEAAPEAQQSFTVTAAPELAAGIPTAGSGVSGGSSETLSFTPTVAPTSSLTIIGSPRIDPRSGAITFVVSVSGGGMLSWLLTFRNGSFGALEATTKCTQGRIVLRGHCHVRLATFATGLVPASRAGRITFTARPSTVAVKALRAGAVRRKSLAVQATLSFRGGVVGKPVSQTRLLSDRVRR